MNAVATKDRLFDQLLSNSDTRSGPLHAQIREALRKLIHKDYTHGEKFLSEPELISRLGISQSTVRRALLDLAAEGLLVRKVPAGTFVNKVQAEFSLVGVFVPCYDSPSLSILLEYIMRACRKRNLSVMLHHTYQNERVAEALAGIGTNPAECRFILLSNSARATRDLYRNLSKRGFHTVNVDTLLDNYSGNYAGVNNEAGIELGLRHLKDLGHRQISLIVNEPMTVGSIRRRVRAFQEFSLKFNLHVKIVDCKTEAWTDSFDAAYQKMGDLWDAKDRPTAVMSVSDVGAWAALQWFAERSIKVPQEVSILGFDGNSINRYFSPPLTSIAQPWEEIGIRTVELLENSGKTPRRFFCNPILLEGKSTAAISAH